MLWNHFRPAQLATISLPAVPEAVSQMDAVPLVPEDTSTPEPSSPKDVVPTASKALSVVGGVDLSFLQSEKYKSLKSNKQIFLMESGRNKNPFQSIFAGE